MAYCKDAEKIKMESQGSWRDVVLQCHMARCVLCRAILEIDPDGYLPESVARKLGAEITVKHKNGWTGSPRRRVTTIKGQELNISE